MSLFVEASPIPPESSPVSAADQSGGEASCFGPSGGKAPIASSDATRLAADVGDNGEPPETQFPDVLSAHKRRRTEPSRTALAYPRKRAVAACRQCRARKVKCNNARPSCGSCVASKSQCHYEDSQDHSAFDPASLLILERLDQVLVRLNQPPPALSETPTTVTTTAQCSSVCSNNQPPTAAGSLERGEPDYHHLRIPSSKTTPDAILQWPIFNHRYPPNYIIDATFIAEVPDKDSDAEYGNAHTGGKGGKYCSPRLKGARICEEEIPDLVQRFLDLVHIKNPILDPDMIWSYVRHVGEEGLEWDSSSCLVLLACALGCVAQPFQPIADGRCSSLEMQRENLQKGEKYYNLARRRLGLLERDILAPQCQFLAGVYLMYTLRPLSAWSEFHSASKSYHVYLQCQVRQPPRFTDPEKASKRRKLEQRLYWSCYKSECELRTEMDLPNSSLADFQYPDMHPSPPDVPSPVGDDEGTPHEGLFRSPGNYRRSMRSLRQYEQSWFYYLTEITLRRIANRVLNTFYSDSHGSWTDEGMPMMIKSVCEFEQQLQEWYDGLPAPIQFEEGIMPTEELRYMVYTRQLDIKACMYRPFLYYAVHNPPNARYQALVMPYVEKALTHSLQVVHYEPVRHRHHGVWYGTRAGTNAALSLLAAVRCGNINVPHGWVSAIQCGLARLRYWEHEAPGATRSIEAIEDIMSTLSVPCNEI